MLPLFAPSDKVESSLRMQEQMESSRSVFDSHWREVAELCRPNQNLFQQQTPTQGEKKNQRIFDATAMLALPKFAAATVSMAFPASQKWHKLAPANYKLAGNHEVRVYCDEVVEALFAARYAPQSGWEYAISEVALDIGAFGPGILFVDDELGRGLRYMSVPLSQCWFATSHSGNINRVHRKFELNAFQAAEKFGKENLSDAVLAALNVAPLTTFWFLHCVYPSDDERMAFDSLYIDVQAKKVCMAGGYRTMPYAVGNYEVAPGETYGRGPAMLVLPTIQTLNEMKKTVLRAGQRVVDPPIMLTMDASLQAFNVRSNALNYGYLDQNGNPLAKPFVSGGRVDIGRDMMQDEREVINDAFFVTLFRVLIETPQITATEAMLRAQEKGQLIGPVIARVQSGIANTVIMRELDILQTAGALPEMPEVLANDPNKIKIVYEGPINQMQKAGAGAAVMNSVQSLAALSQLDPTVMMMVDGHAAARIVLEANGVPEKMLRSDEESTALAEQAAQQQQQQQLLAAAPVAASAAKDFAQAEATATASPEADMFGGV